MEYIDCKDLEVYITQTADFLSVDMVRKWAIELCDVLGYLHTHQPGPYHFPRREAVEHHDSTSQGNVRLIYFGIAKPPPNQPKGNGYKNGTYRAA